MTSEVRPEDVEAVVEAFQASGCAELHIRFDGFELRLSADGEEPMVSTAAPAVARPAPSAPSRAPVAARMAEAAVDEGALAGLEIVRAPYLGTFYRAPKPGEPSYVEVGSEVQPDSDLCLVEVMKLFTAVRAGVTGVVAHILAADGAMVETGQPLFAIKGAAEMAIKRLFIANRGEIALRIQRAAQALGIETVVGVSAADVDSAAAKLADRAVVIGPGPAAKSYLDARLVVHAAKETGCDALHPGYGFLSERPVLPRLCDQHGIVFVGPTADTIEALGDKLRARSMAKAAGVPLVPGTDEVHSAEEARRFADEIGYPVLLKASAGGGGRGMVIARNGSEVEAGFAKASAEALAAFNDGTIFMERFVGKARHVEVQLMGDGQGKVLHFGERDCSVQRRYQKLVEEAPCAAMPDELRAKLHASAVSLAASVNYRNAGTAEFLYDVERQEIYFIEVNARIQVEHPVSEMISGHDLVQWQLRIAGGEPLSLEQSDIRLLGHAIECRINAEDPDQDFRPSPGRITRWSPPTGEGVRLDSHMSEGAVIPPFYDSMIGKLIVTGDTRKDAVARLSKALADFTVEGPPTTIPLHRRIAASPDFIANRIDTGWLEHTLLPLPVAAE